MSALLEGDGGVDREDDEANAASPPTAAAATNTVAISWSDAPTPFLWKLFQFLIMDKKLPEYVKCVTCKRPAHWLLRGKTVTTLKSVCSNWRKIVNYSIIISPMLHNDRLLVCPLPLQCAWKYVSMIENNVFAKKIHEPIYLLFRQ